MKNLMFVFGLCMTFSAFAEGLLYIGDSHSYIREQNPLPANKRFGNVFVEGMSSRGFEVSYYAACGSAPIGWVRGSTTQCGYTAYADGSFSSVVTSAFPSVSKLYHPEKHSRVVINLGDNMFDWKTVRSKKEAAFNRGSFINSINSFLALLPGISPENCTWIGPTYHIEGSTYRKGNAAVDELYVNLNSLLSGRCSVIDARPIVVPTVPNDGLHHVNADSQALAEGVLNLL